MRRRDGARADHVIVDETQGVEVDAATEVAAVTVPRPVGRRPLNSDIDRGPTPPSQVLAAIISTEGRRQATMTARGEHDAGRVGLANPFLRCDHCRERVKAWHDQARCGDGCDGGGARGGWWNLPCGHQAGVTSECETWTPVDGCICVVAGLSSVECGKPIRWARVEDVEDAEGEGAAE